MTKKIFTMVRHFKLQNRIKVPQNEENFFWSRSEKESRNILLSTEMLIEEFSKNGLF